MVWRRYSISGGGIVIDVSRCHYDHGSGFRIRPILLPIRDAWTYDVRIDTHHGG
jgi:hypothetical protein